jgi:hypothetical protein
VRLAGSGGRYAGRNSATRHDSTRIERVQPIRSPITVAGIVGYALSSSRMRGSTASTIDPASLRSYLGGASERSAAFTVFREMPNTRAISEIDTFSARRSRRISAQPSTASNPFLLWLGQEPESSGRWSVFRLRPDQFFTCRRQR